MSRIAVVLLAAALLWLAPGVAIGADERESPGQASAAQSEKAPSCAEGSEAPQSEKAAHCTARGEIAGSEAPGAQEMPIYIPPNRGAPPTRIGGGSRGGAHPVRRS